MKKILYFTIILLLIFPIMVFAENESYITYEDIKADGNNLMGWWMSEGTFNYAMNNSKNYEFTLKGYNLDNNKKYIFSLNSDFIDYKKTYTGEELMNGINVSRTDGNGLVSSKVYSIDDNIYLNMKFEDNMYLETNFYFNDNFDDSELDNFYNKIVKKGALNINAIIPDDTYYYETAITSSLQSYIEEPFSIYGFCDEDNKCYLCISDTRYNNHYKSYEVKYKFEKTDKEIKEKVDKYTKKFPIIGDNFDENKLFTLDDLENINYKYAVMQYNKGEDIDIINAEINYSSEIQKILEYGNITAIMDARAGWDDDFSSGAFGFLNLKYNDTIYGYINGAGVKQNNVIYVSNDTKNSREAYIKEAKRRIEEYLPNVKVSIKYAGQIKDLDDSDWIIEIDDMVDVKKTLGEYYIISLNDNDYYFFIAKDSSKIKNPEMNTTDLKTNITINTKSSSVPLDTKIIAREFGKKTNEYKEQLNKTSLKNAKVVDLKLYSNSTNEYIEKLSDDNFIVSIPLEEKDINKQLVAYYVKDDGTIEEHEITIKDGYAFFETNHFSTYTIGEKINKTTESKISNPQTIDIISKWISLVFISITGLVITYCYKIKNNQD